jgi:hypothetical protein
VRYDIYIYMTLGGKGLRTDGRVLIGFVWLRIGICGEGGRCKYGSEPLCFMNFNRFID